MSEEPENRTESGRGPDGRFLPGTSPNPGGRPKANHRVVELAREHTAAAIETLVRIMQSETEPANSRVAAAGHLLDRAWGKPTQPIAADDFEGFALKVEWVQPNGNRSRQTGGSE